MKIFAIDTSAAASSAAVTEDGRIISELYINVKLTHSQTLIPVCKSALDCACIQLKDIDAFAVSTGPGSFTGLRIGIASIKGMAYALKKPCIPVSSLEALAYNLSGFNAIICAVMDARCGQFYNALFKSENGEISRICEDRAIMKQNLYNELSKMSGDIILTGDGANLCFEQNTSGRYLAKAPENLRYAHASSVALAAEKHRELAEDSGKLMPRYLRLPQAERERLKRERSAN